MGKKEAKEWLSRAKKDMEEAEFLLKNDRPEEFVGFFGVGSGIAIPEP